MENYLKEILKVLEKNNKGVFTLDEAVQYTSIGKTRLIEIINTPGTDFPYFRNGKKILINKSKLDEWLDKTSESHRVV